MVAPPPGSPPAEPTAVPAGPPAKSGAVTAVAIVNFVFGGLDLLCGLLVLVGGAAVAGLVAVAGHEGGAGPEAGTVAAVVGGLIIVFAVFQMLLGVPTILAGVGVLKRARWGRILTLVLGALSGVLAVFNLFSLDIRDAILHGGYCAMVYAILLNKQYAAEFR